MRQTVSQEPLDREKPLQLETVFVDYRILALIDWDATVTAFSSSKRPLMRHGLLLVFSLFLSADPASPQAPPMTEAPHEAETGAPAWTWTTDANVFFGYNYQERKFTDIWAWESQNWFMLAGQRTLGVGRLSVDGMISLEPFTLQAIGSPQVFQTGETFNGGALVDYQHPTKW